MKVLFIHQNFPGQFKHLAPALVLNNHIVFAMTMQKVEVKKWKGVTLLPYVTSRGTSQGVHPWVSDFETKVIRGEACYRAAIKLRDEGFYPDVIIAHHGWGESLFIKEVWPKSKLAIYCEFYYHSNGADVGFDPEFPVRDNGDECRLRLKNLNNFLHFGIADAGISPTKWQASTFPEPFRSSISVIHDGIDTQMIVPNPFAELVIKTNKKELKLSKKDELITFVNRNLEPYRGYHIFMRALPDILKQRPNARVLIVGADDVSYGSRPTVDLNGGTKWKEIFVKEVKAKISDSDWDRVHFLGQVSYQHFIPLLQISTVHVYLTYPFILSWSLLEAMSASCAIVASDTLPLHEAIQHNETGRLVDFFDAKSLSQEIVQLLERPLERKRLGDNARNFAVQNFDLKSVCLPKQLEWAEKIGLPTVWT